VKKLKLSKKTLKNLRLTLQQVVPSPNPALDPSNGSSC